MHFLEDTEQLQLIAYCVAICPRPLLDTGFNFHNIIFGLYKCITLAVNICNNAGTLNARSDEGERLSHLVARDVISCACEGSQKVGHETLRERGSHSNGGAEIIKEERTECSCSWPEDEDVEGRGGPRETSSHVFRRIQACILVWSSWRHYCIPSHIREAKLV